MRLLSFAFLTVGLASCSSNVTPSTTQGPPILDDGIPDLPPADDEPPKDAPADPDEPRDPDAPPAPEKCGNGTKDPGESCDGSDLASTTCAMLGFDGGALDCRGDCTGFDTGACTAPAAPPLAAPSPIAAAGASIAFAGSIDLTDPSWTRPAQDCAAGSEGGRRFDVHRVVNNTGAPQALTVLGAFSGDGYLHAYSGTFDPAAPTVGCIGGDDDGTGGTTQSEIVALPISAGQIVTIVVSTYAADAALGAYSLTVTTLGDGGTPITAVCGDGLVDGAELCDVGALAGDTCGDHGFNRGDLACAAGCAAVDTAACWSIAAPVSIAPRGSSVSVSGALAMTDAKWIRPTESCAAGTATSADRFFDAAQIVNNTGQPQTIDLTATFAGDGFLHVFGAAFAPTSPTSDCIRGDDDFNGSTASQLTGVTIAAGQTLVVVASTFTANVALGAWSVEVRTTQPAVCGNGIIEGSESCDGSSFGGQTCVGRGFEGGALACNASCGAVVESNCWDLPAATPIAAQGGSVAFDGALGADDPMMDRVSETCTGTGPADHPWQGFRIVNNAGSARSVTITASWSGGDGFLHAYNASSFDPASPLSGCIKGDDDFGVDGSQLVDVAMAAGQTLVIVASTYAANGSIAAFDIEVATNAAPAAPATPIAAKGLTMQLSGSIDASDASYERLSETCTSTGAQRKFDAYRVQNTTGVAQKLTVHGNWSGDGFVHVMGGTFDAASPGQSCRRGDDDFGTNASRLTGVDIAAGETIVVVASTFSTTTIGAYTLDVLTEGDAASIASPGGSITTRGALHASDPLWNRPSESCSDDAGTAANFHDVHHVKNATASERVIDVTATWTGGDGFLAVYFGDFTPSVAASDQCIDADDDNNGTTSSRVDAVTIFPGETLTIVASSFMPSTPITSYALDVHTR
jgi:hypothetical protein